MSDVVVAPLDPEYRIEPLDHSDASTVDAVLSLWRREDAVAGDEANRRVHEVLLVASSEATSELAGLCTTPLYRHPRLAMDLWYLRVLVSGAHRQTLLATHLAVRARDLLEERFTSGEDTRGAGLVTDVQSDDLVRTQIQAVWRRTRLTYIGDNSRGEQMRVHYFAGALAPPPPPAASAQPR